jgi:hypothetical protein
MIPKYKVWDKDGKDWVKQTGNPCIFPFNGVIAMKCNGDSTGHIDTREDLSPYYEMVVCTGILDIALKEEYEGDLVRDSDKEIWLVTLDNPFGVIYQSIKTGERIFAADFFRPHVIIGNIQEHPELLKGGN